MTPFLWVILVIVVVFSLVCAAQWLAMKSKEKREADMESLTQHDNIYDSIHDDKRTKY
ncbi:MAG: signal transduction histidine kinase [Alphaproteobacteria bacterium]|jgi:signal transduction histidine kinase